jgi:hypothetical protein
VRARGAGSLLWSLALIALGVALLFSNFLLLSDFNLAALWPLLLVVAGAQILLHGDLLPNAETRTFGITRGSVESATLEINAGEIDVRVGALDREGRLIAGRFAVDSRPELNVIDTYTQLKMDRLATPWFAFADWEVALASDLPWQVFISTSLGQVEAALADVIVQDVVIATGIGDIRLTCPREAYGALQLRSAVGTIQVITPSASQARITVKATPLFRVHVDEQRYEQAEPGVYRSRLADATRPFTEIIIGGTFGDAYLA